MSQSRQQSWPSYWIFPLSSADALSTTQLVINLICERRMFGMSERGRVRLKAGDRVCYHASTIGIVADGIVKSEPSKDRNAISPFHPWFYQLEEVHCYTYNPIKLDASLRKRLDAFLGKNTEDNWSWFIQHGHRITKHDFDLLTRN